MVMSVKKKPCILVTYIMFITQWLLGYAFNNPSHGMDESIFK